MAPSKDLVSVLLEDTELAGGLDPAETAVATRKALARVVSLPKGMFCPREALPAKPGTFGMLMLDGLLLRGVSVAERTDLEVMGPGDVIRPFDGEPDPYAIVPAVVGWWALRPARLAVLDAGFIRRMSDHPLVIADLAERIGSHAATAGLRLSIVQQPRLTVRLQLMLCHLADHFGRVQADGIVLPLPLCHGLLAWLVGARRPAVSTAVNELERAQLLARRPDDTWWLSREMPEALAKLTAYAREVAA